MGCMSSKIDDPVGAAPATKAGSAGQPPNMEIITKDIAADCSFECVTDATTTFKYLTNRN